MAKGLALRNLALSNIGETLEDARVYRNDKGRAYDEGFREFIECAVDVTLFGKPYLAHRNINFYVDMTSSCTCDCEFCIAKVDFGRREEPLDNLDQYFAKALSFLVPIDPSVQITGGEPTLYPRILSKLLAVVDQEMPKRPVLNTNGYGLWGGLLNRIKRSRLEHINISRHHYNDETNAQIMKGHSISSDILSEAVRGISNRVRIQCNLIGDYIDTYGEVMQFIAYAYHRLGARNIAFAQLTPLPRDSYYRTDIVDYVAARPVDTDAILEMLEKDSRFAFEKYRGGVACYYEVWKFNAYEEPVTIVFKYSDNSWLEKADADERLLPDIIMHTDGSVCGSWCKERKILWKAGGGGR